MNHLNSFLQKICQFQMDYSWIEKKIKYSCKKEGLNFCGDYGRKRLTFIWKGDPKKKKKKKEIVN